MDSCRAATVLPTHQPSGRGKEPGEGKGKGKEHMLTAHKGEPQGCVTTAGGWVCFLSLLLFDVAVVLGILEYNGALSLWGDGDDAFVFGKPSASYGKVAMTAGYATSEARNPN